MEFYLFIFVIALGLTLSFFKKGLIGHRPHDFDKFTPELLEAQRKAMGEKDYAKWLRRRYTELWAMVLESREKRLEIRSSWVEATNLMEKEMESLRKQDGSPLLPEIGKRLSDELNK